MTRGFPSLTGHVASGKIKLNLEIPDLMIKTFKNVNLLIAVTSFIVAVDLKSLLYVWLPTVHSFVVSWHSHSLVSSTRRKICAFKVSLNAVFINPMPPPHHLHTSVAEEGLLVD